MSGLYVISAVKRSALKSAVMATIHSALSAELIPIPIWCRHARCEKVVPGHPDFACFQNGTINFHTTDVVYTRTNAPTTYTPQQYWTLWNVRTDTNDWFESWKPGPTSLDDDVLVATGFVKVSTIDAAGKISVTNSVKYWYNRWFNGGDTSDPANYEHEEHDDWDFAGGAVFEPLTGGSVVEVTSDGVAYYAAYTFVSGTEIRWSDFGHDGTVSVLSEQVDVGVFYDAGRNEILVQDFDAWSASSSVAGFAITFNEAAALLTYPNQPWVYLDGGTDLSYGTPVLDTYNPTTFTHHITAVDRQDTWDGLAQVDVEDVAVQIWGVAAGSGVSCAAGWPYFAGTEPKRWMRFFRGQIKPLVDITVWVARVRVGRGYDAISDTVFDVVRVDIVHRQIALARNTVYEPDITDPGQPPWNVTYSAGPASYFHDFNVVQACAYAPATWLADWMSTTWDVSGFDCSVLAQTGHIEIARLSGGAIVIQRAGSGGEESSGGSTSTGSEQSEP
jgi:hypothetical protein